MNNSRLGSARASAKLGEPPGRLVALSIRALWLRHAISEKSECTNWMSKVLRQFLFDTSPSSVYHQGQNLFHHWSLAETGATGSVCFGVESWRLPLISSLLVK